MPDSTDVTLGLLEVRSLARGIEAADAMIKKAPVTVLWTRIVEPGRHLTLIRGSVDDVREALRLGRAVAAADLHDELFLASPHPSLLEAIAAPRTGADPFEALGLIECASVAAALLAADAAAKEAAVRLLAVRVGPDMHGKGLIALSGEVADVESAVARGAALAEARAMLVRIAVIPNATARTFEAAVRG